MSNEKPQIGVIGMAVMGKNLALNIESRGYKVAIFNRTGAKTEKVVKDHADKQLVIRSKTSWLHLKRHDGLS